MAWKTNLWTAFHARCVQMEMGASIPVYFHIYIYIYIYINAVLFRVPAMMCSCYCLYLHAPGGPRCLRNHNAQGCGPGPRHSQGGGPGPRHLGEDGDSTVRFGIGAGLFLAAGVGPASALLALVLCWRCECFGAGSSCFTDTTCTGVRFARVGSSCFTCTGVRLRATAGDFTATCTGVRLGATAGDFTAMDLDLDTAGAGATSVYHCRTGAAMAFAGTGGSSGASGACGSGGGGPGGASGASAERGSGRGNRRGVRLRLQSLRLPVGALGTLLLLLASAAAAATA